MEKNKADLLSEVASYYSGKLAEHGETPRGVDWNGEEGQVLRFEQLCRILPPPHLISLVSMIWVAVMALYWTI
jgi:hypothetical protein